MSSHIHAIAYAWRVLVADLDYVTQALAPTKRNRLAQQLTHLRDQLRHSIAVDQQLDAIQEHIRTSGRREVCSDLLDVLDDLLSYYPADPERSGPAPANPPCTDPVSPPPAQE